MDYNTYQSRVLDRASHRWFADKVDRATLGYILERFIFFGNELDMVKKSLMYGRDNFNVATGLHTPDEQTQRIIHAMLGAATEGVEMMEALQRNLVDRQPFDLVNLQEEFGDAEWYRALFLDAVKQSHEDNLEQNDAKLEKRFGRTFTVEDANQRNLEEERATLERFQQAGAAKPAGSAGLEDLA